MEINEVFIVRDSQLSPLESGLSREVENGGRFWMVKRKYVCLIYTTLIDSYLKEMYAWQIVISVFNLHCSGNYSFII